MNTAHAAASQKYMGKKKGAPKATLYVDIDPLTKKRLDRLAGVRHRKLNAEVQLALDRYLDEEEPKEKKLPPLEPEAE